MPSMIFHHPRPIVGDGGSGSTVRPYRMLDAFRGLGYEVEVVVGYAAERKQAVERAKGQVARGRSFDFAYAECCTIPTLLAEPSHLPLHPLLDFGFLRWLKIRRVPVGLFYRDVHWRFEHYRRQVSWLKRAIALPLYHYDWWQYGRCVDHLFLPSPKMRDALPGAWPPVRLSALPPGCELPPLSQQGPEPGTGHAGALRLFYVGGVTPPLYDLKMMVDVVQRLDAVTLTLCCRRQEWAKVEGYYAPLDEGKVRVVHAQGHGLGRLYADADAFLLAWKGNSYLDFAMPVKLFEALGYALPIITMEGTSVARFVAGEAIGWVVSTADELPGLLVRLNANRELLAQKRARMMSVRERHTWQARARAVADVLGRRQELR